MLKEESTHRVSQSFTLCVSSSAMGSKRKDEIIERALRRAHALGWNQSELARKLQVDPANVTNWKTRGLPADQYEKVAHALGWSLDELVRGAAADLRESEPEPSFNVIRTWDHPEDLPDGEFVFVPRLEVSLSAGHGREQIAIAFGEQQPQAFRADWIRRERLKPSKLACMTAVGPSMEPSIWDGDSLVVDTSQTDVLDGRVYALWYEGGERVKRLFRLPGGGLQIKSDNSAYPTLMLDAVEAELVRVLGRVVHRSGKGGL